MAHITALKQVFFAKPKSCYLYWNKDFHLAEIVGNDFQRNMSLRYHRDICFAGHRKTKIPQYVGNI